MELILYILLGLMVVGFSLVFYWLIKNKKSAQPNEAMLMMQEQLKEMRMTIDNKLTESSRVMQAQFGQTAQIVKDVTERLTKLDETNKQVINFADQLQNLQDILKNPKQRGILGEYYLETVLKNVLPPKSYQMQYKIGKDDDGKDLIVDAVVFVKDKIIPIDSKFSLENYNRILEERDQSERERLEKLFKQDLKNRIDETAKYIKPESGTMDFAFMFIPSEAIFYDLLINQIGTIKANTRDLIEYSIKEKHVIIVSPTSFLAYLQTVLQGLRALKIEESVKEIIKKIGELNKHILSYEEYMKKLGNNLGTTVNSYNQAYKEFKKIDKDLVKITGKEAGGEPLRLEKPEE
ncbi:MAG: DNA recombination protein RmuC [Ignavibacterium sp.]|nr:DNA recombination protein RmuC [Ignavibacterium sp.]